MSHLPGADLEVRRHLTEGLGRLTSPQRIAYLQRLCSKCSGFAGLGVKVTSSTGLVSEVLNDTYMLVFQHGLSLQDAALELERTLRRL